MEKISPAYISVKVSQLWRMMNYSVNDKSFFFFFFLKQGWEK